MSPAFTFWQEKCFQLGTDLQAFVILRTNILHHPHQTAGSGAGLTEEECMGGYGEGWVARVLGNQASWL